MGFMGLSHPYESDEASDYIRNITKQVANVSEKELENEANQYNTPGYINVALMFETMVNPVMEMYKFDDGLLDVAKQTLKLLKENRKAWVDCGHGRDYDRMISVMNLYIAKCEG
jgi:hypothetical protein